MRKGRSVMLSVIVGLLCCVMQAAECPDGVNPVPGQMTAYSSEEWQEKIKTCLEQEGQVKVFYFPKEKQRYSMTCDIKSCEVKTRISFKNKCDNVIFPLQYTLQQEVLRGHILKRGFFAPGVTGTDFSHKDVDLKDYYQKPFYSPSLDYFLTELLPKLAAQGQGDLTADMLKEALPSRKSKRFFWRVVFAERAVEVLQEGAKQPEVLCIIGGVGMLWGKLSICLTRNLYKYDKRSLLYYKLEKVRGHICAKYPFSLYKEESCLNYTGQNTVETWQATIKESLEQEDHVRMAYFSKEDEFCSVAYNVKSSNVLINCFLDKENRVKVALPLSYYLHQLFLKGYVLKPGCSPPTIKSVDFSENDVNLEHYDRQPFSSAEFDDVLAGYLPMLDVVAASIERGWNKKEKADNSDIFAFIADVRSRVLPKSTDYPPFFWHVVYEDEAMEILYEMKKEPEVLLIIGGVGMLWGSLTHGLSEDRHKGRSLHGYKMSSVLGAICAKYACPQEERRPGFHDIETNAQAL